MAHYPDDKVAASTNRYGKGRAVLIGSLLGAAYRKRASTAPACAPTCWSDPAGPPRWS